MSNMYFRLLMLLIRLRLMPKVGFFDAVTMPMRAWLTDIDLTDAQTIGIGMLHGFDDLGDREGRQQLCLVLDMLDLEPDHGQLVGQLVVGLRVECLVVEGVLEAVFGV